MQLNLACMFMQFVPVLYMHGAILIGDYTFLYNRYFEVLDYYYMDDGFLR